MSKDGPTSSRMGFGYLQARDAGAPYTAPRSGAEMNLERFLTRHPELLSRAIEMRNEGCRSDTIISTFREEGVDGRFALEFWRDADREKWVGVEYADDRKKLEEKADWGFSRGVYKAVLLWELSEASGKWSEIRWWPDQDEW